MSRATDLLQEATPLPWHRSGPGPEPDGDQVWLVGAGNQATFIAYTDASFGAMADFDLAAYAVNRLPDYEAAVEALERLLRFTHALTAADHEAPFRAGAELLDLHFAEAVAVRLRDEVPA